MSTNNDTTNRAPIRSTVAIFDQTNQDCRKARQSASLKLAAVELIFPFLQQLPTCALRVSYIPLMMSFRQQLTELVSTAIV